MADSQATLPDKDDAALASAAAPRAAEGASAAAPRAAEGASAAAPRAPESSAWALLGSSEGGGGGGGDDDDDDGIEILSGAAPPPWPCLLCTFLNAPDTADCAVCFSIHGLPYSRVLKNFHVSSLVRTPSPVLPWLYIGAVIAAEKQWLNFFSHIVCVMELAPGAQHPAQDRDPRTFAYLPVPGSCGATICPANYAAYQALLPGAFKVINHAHDHARAGSRVLVHCEHGISRSAAVMAAYVLAHSAKLPELLPALGVAPSGKATLAFLKTKRSIIQPAKGLCAAVEAYAKLQARSGGGGGGGGGGASSSGGGGGRGSSDCTIM